MSSQDPSIGFVPDTNSESVFNSKWSNILLAFWCISLPINTFVIIPSNQGSQIANMIGLCSIIFIFLAQANLSRQSVLAYWRDWAILSVIWLVFFSASQLAHIFNGMVPIEGLNLIKGDAKILFRPQLFTQSLYLVSCFATFTFFRHFLPKEYFKYIFFGAWFMVLYGFYEWLYFTLFGKSGDFIANRVMIDDVVASWTQGSEIAGLSTMRFKSTFGEPSFYTAAAVPFLFLSFLTRRYILGFLLLTSVVLSWSTTGFVGTFCAIILMGVAIPKARKSALICLILAGILFSFFTVALPDVYDSMFRAKITGENESGYSRQVLNYNADLVLQKLSYFQKLVGIGFGYTYSNVWGAIKTNTGFLGAAVFACFFLYPYLAFVLHRQSSPWPLAAAIIFMLYYLNVAELFLPTTWAILGLSWRSVDEVREIHHDTSL